MPNDLPIITPEKVQEAFAIAYLATQSEDEEHTIRKALANRYAPNEIDALIPRVLALLMRLMEFDEIGLIGSVTALVHS